MAVRTSEPVDGFTLTYIRSDNALPRREPRYGRRAI